eukprot:TRINITY_DN9414_c0_g1_i9.p1 TRINITY_DN9414_c0_g1~~TRINITY_DN9414_c0_g1_i9.p1  ORF type:complete len:120 (-),score=10.92 TRINITY_DN9414_c0_g1_i9:816-1175(-)
MHSVYLSAKAKFGPSLHRKIRKGRFRRVAFTRALLPELSTMLGSKTTNTITTNHAQLKTPVITNRFLASPSLQNSTDDHIHILFAPNIEKRKERKVKSLPDQRIPIIISETSYLTNINH